MRGTVKLGVRAKAPGAAANTVLKRPAAASKVAAKSYTVKVQIMQSKRFHKIALNSSDTIATLKKNINEKETGISSLGRKGYESMIRIKYKMETMPNKNTLEDCGKPGPGGIYWMVAEDMRS
eukprot:TRINITY_DN114921_c0_g1_i1.p1 TRINITY_DN114921_c0_g1~~TRINITY_DN114921_c0_g1_i1.p1  ORF type:complete len:122 (-),score=34.19 TRINITY_DN114921_c0_g1_i1:173-538(-)